jgi:hypothetical protein
MGGPGSPEQLRECPSRPTMAAHPAPVPHPPGMTLNAVAIAGFSLTAICGWVFVRWRFSDPRISAGDGKDLPGTRHPFQLVDTAAFQPDRGARDQVANGAGHQDLIRGR